MELQDIKLLEEKAYQFLSEENFSEAFNLFNKIAEIYKEKGEHKQAALCFASSASCWNKKIGEKVCEASAIAYKKAALEAEIAKDFEYASLLYKMAAINYERDMDLINFSECFYKAKDNYRKFLNFYLINFILKMKNVNVRDFFKNIFLWFTFTFSYLIWGYGERPIRTLIWALVVILLSSILYSLGFLIQNSNIIIKPSLSQALYFSTITFTTVGYGDFTPVGINKFIAVLEALSGLIIVPIFIIGFSRKYLRF
ncbi:MAG: ion channel [Candidatus Aenigmatarchaeota archaeon]